MSTGAGVDAVGGAQVHRQAFSARLLQQRLGLVGVVGALGNVVGPVGLGRRMVEVVADGGGAEGDLLDDFLAVHRQLQRVAHVGIVEGRGIAMHRQRDRAGRGHVVDDDVGITLHQGHGLQLDQRNRVNVPGHQRRLARVRVVQGNHLDLVEIGALAMPALVAAEVEAHAELAVVDLVGARAVAALPVDRTVLVRRADGQVVVGHQPGQVGVAARKLDDNGMVAVGGNVRDVGEQRLGGRGALVAAMVVERGDDVIGGEFPAGVEAGLVGELEGPLRGVGAGFPAGCQVGTERPVTVDHGQVAAVRMRKEDHRAGQIGARIVGVAGVAVVNAPAERSALLGRGPLPRSSTGPWPRSSSGRRPSNSA